ncbi:pentatricopeptide repeat-containing protein At5g15300 [Cryptomeria japonica]|uniref:pentatricopeptide repeat-containing protein At5g15300 n=1 Tax=Cryptomeria japonica TaxID=3369 RepID=UPI0027DAA9B5|nr:pentatricopeptide repeat-containing protein At5g15300 [Cryptomeria japonica]
MKQPIKPRKRLMVWVFVPFLHFQCKYTTTRSIVVVGFNHANPNSKDNSDAFPKRNFCQRGNLKEALNVLGQDISLRSCIHVSLLQECLNNRFLPESKLVHAHIIQTACQCKDMNILMTIYAKCGKLDEARRILKQMNKPDVISMTVIIAAYARRGHAQEALAFFYEMQQANIKPNQFTFASVLSACADLQNLEKGKQIHKDIIRSGFQSDIVIGNALLDMYAKCNSLKDARNVFDKITQRDVITWTTMVAGHAQSGNLDIAQKLFDAMPERNVVSWNAMISGYAQNGDLDKALELFLSMPERNIVSWNLMIEVHAKNGNGVEALRLFQQMQKSDVRPNLESFRIILPVCADLATLKQDMEFSEVISRNGFQIVSMLSKQGQVKEALHIVDLMDQPLRFSLYSHLLQDCTKKQTLSDGKQVHNHMTARGLKPNVSLGNILITMYDKCGSLVDAQGVFDQMPMRNLISWTAMISAYTRHGYSEEALILFYQMKETGIQPNQFTFASILSSCADMANLEKGKEIHEEIIRNEYQSDVYVGNALVDMYAKCGNIDSARDVFEKILQKDVVSWTTMIAGYAHNGYTDEAFHLFQKMPERNIVSWNAMISGYMQNGHIEDALNLFQKISKRNSVSWNAMIAGYVQNGYGEEALKLFQEMQSTDMKLNTETFVIVLSACANIAGLQEGIEAHEVIIKSGFQSNISVGNSLVGMYAKCGSIEDAFKVFDKMHERDVVSWNAIIAGYAVHGFGKKALQLFEKMQQSGRKPNHVTFIGVLTACCHAGLVDEGWLYFHNMNQYYNISPVMEHYGCMVDLLGRAGCLDEAQTFIYNMPIKPDAAIWLSLLGACKIHMNIELGEKAARQLFDLNSKNTAPYVLLSNIYASAGRWDNLKNVRKMMIDKKVQKSPGCSWIVIRRQVYTFLSKYTEIS